ncbi:MAG: bifunctional adenosylcobinamide kinase/adenosylcobinamide-phosphate guanylyltransferase [Pirellulales bacterium]|nr:bifunctional adenosylcobinamide kinase/adenosylcobinamide-phosphate guanylyltransferase [Pirellulales bacterium]
MIADSQASRLGGSITLVLGGVRSGKSRFAQELAGRVGGDDVLFVATAQPGDGEMEQRIKHHRRSRRPGWKTLERPLGTGAAIEQLAELPSVVLVDCLTMLVSNVICQEGKDSAPFETWQADVIKEVDALLGVAASRAVDLLIVSGEVGSGVVPDHPLGRAFRDLLGMANQRVAAAASATYCLMAGLAVNLTDLATTVDQAAQRIGNSNSRGAQ